MCERSATVNRCEHSAIIVCVPLLHPFCNDYQSSLPKTRGSRRGARAGTGGHTGRGGWPVASGRRSRVLRTAGANGSSIAPSTSTPNTSAASPASLSVRTTPSTSQWPGTAAVPQFLEMIREEVRQQLAAQSGSTSATSSHLPTSLVPTPLDAAGTPEPGMVLHAVLHGCLLL